MSYRKRSFLVVAVACLSFLLNACGGPTKVDQSPNGDPHLVRKDYSQTSNLNFVHTGNAMATRVPNLVHLQGVGPQSTYTVQYKFNSGSNTIFRVLKLHKSVVNQGGTLAEAKMSLLQGSTVQDLRVGESKTLTINTDYTLQITHPQNSTSFDLLVDPVTWMGTSTTEDPMVARTCQTQQGSMVFFSINANIMGYMTTPATKLYLSPQTFCGESFNSGDQAQCQATKDKSNQDFPALTRCNASEGWEKRSFVLNFKKTILPPYLICKKNLSQVRVSLGQCEDFVMDYAPFYAAGSED